MRVPCLDRALLIRNDWHGACFDTHNIVLLHVLGVGESDHVLQSGLLRFQRVYLCRALGLIQQRRSVSSSLATKVLVMTTDSAEESLRAEHTIAAIRLRLSAATSHSYLRDFVYGGIDGAVTTFAVVSGVAGAGLSPGIVVVLGLANLVGDGFSMAASNFLGSRADLQLLERTRRIEEQHIERYPEGEREEVRQILAAKGFSGDSLEEAVRIITADKNLWVETMLKEEHGLSLDRPSPLQAATVTFLAFTAIGFLPLIAFLAELLVPQMVSNPFIWSTVLTGIGFFAVGAVKSQFVADRWYLAGLETLSLGGVAAALAFAVGFLLRDLV